MSLKYFFLSSFDLHSLSNIYFTLFTVWMLKRMEHYTPNFIRVYGRSIEALDFPIPGRTFLSKRSTRSNHTNEELRCVALHHLIREKGKKYAEEIRAKDKFFMENNYEPMPEIVKQYVHTVREASIDEIRKYDVILCTTAVGANPKVLEATNVYQVILQIYSKFLILNLSHNTNLIISVS